jgi:hypothetical protein
MSDKKTVIKRDVPQHANPEPLSSKLYEAWTETLKIMGSPPLLLPCFQTVTRSHTSEIDMKTKQISIDTGFFGMLLGKGLSEKDAFQALCMHELGHYRYHPYDLATLLLELNSLKYNDEGKFGGPNANSIRLLYDDFCDNLWLLRMIKEPKINLLYRTIDQDNKMPAIVIMRAYLQSVSGVDFGIEESKLSEEMQKKVAALRKIDFFSREANLENISRFAKIMMDIAAEEEENLGGCGGIDIKDFAEQDVEQAMRKIVDQVTKDDWEGIKKWVDEQSGNIGTKLRTDREEKKMKASVEYYKTKASLYPIRILGMRYVVEGTSKAGIDNFNTGDRISSLNPYRSFGIFIPDSGITKKNVYAPSKKFVPSKKVPDSIIVLDSSGSMPNPITENSNAVLGAFAVAMAYLKNKGNVDVINFSSAAKTVKYRDSETVYRTLVDFLGGGTDPPVKELTDLLKENKKDITVITDGFAGADSSMVKQFMQLLDSAGQTHRVSLVYIGKNPPEEFTSYRNIKFHVVTRETDIASIVIGDIEWQ